MHSSQSDRSDRRKNTLVRGVERAERRLIRGAARSRQISRGRLAFFIGAVIVCLGLYQAAWYVSGNVALGAFVLCFVLIAQYHTRFEERLSRLRIWRDLKKQGIARMTLDWESIEHSPVACPVQHPYANDVDLLGTHSLLDVLDCTVSTHGRERLIAWLLEQAPPLTHEDWQSRQTLIRELTNLPLFRDRLQLEARSVDPDTLNGHRLEALFGHSLQMPILIPALLASGILAGITVCLLFLSAFGNLPAYWILSFAIYAWIFFSLAGRLEPLLSKALAIQQELQKLRAVFRLLETRTYSGLPRLEALCDIFHGKGVRPSNELQIISRICAGLSIKGHPLIHLGVNALLPWDLWFAYRFQKACPPLHRQVVIWMDRLATLDAAASLANFAYLHPGYAWPVQGRPDPDQSREVGVAARALGHPLLPQDNRVSNDLSLVGLGRIFLVTGSNMSGKSTFLRTVGINVCLAQAGAPVCAEWFEWTWMRISCCIRVHDSLDEGLSYFYAEVKRLRTILDAVAQRDQPPVLFLIDEIFKGTNNRERLIGSEAFIRALAQGNGLGLITTHDLELARLENDLPGLQNVHFQETVVEGALHFDYWLRPGPCPTTNALRIMAQEGLPIPPVNPGTGDAIKGE